MLIATLNIRLYFEMTNGSDQPPATRASFTKAVDVILNRTNGDLFRCRTRSALAPIYEVSL